ncbi:Piso0_004668 [Millerozyma farinosa CBS 7064]|uniref:Piso0_004668 protein n=1 Tax=Pichia sorbitophila (strain ATCC MYA-4447 / BCRC 22081 / CBS 7064 / NBRC 10061 / NRRL Y-12695) TaxID=559304 RepID=G8Y635_PICSO|nr:Piso0_004668 [Millerozyma farinosa CBS 7064]CCE85096.1 Piso0_004668 [Millerozyma farinosa CBS 7064]
MDLQSVILCRTLLPKFTNIASSDKRYQTGDVNFLEIFICIDRRAVILRLEG